MAAAKRPATKATPSARARARKPRRDWRSPFLEGFALTGTVTGGCSQAGIHRATAYRERDRNEDFRAQWADVEEIVTERLEATALELALAGESRLIEFLLKARRPETYREQHRVEHSGLDGGPISAEIVGVNAREAADATREFLARLAGPDS